jgi:hypothetical protein
MSTNHLVLAALDRRLHAEADQIPIVHLSKHVHGKGASLLEEVAYVKCGVPASWERDPSKTITATLHATISGANSHELVGPGPLRAGVGRVTAAYYCRG